MNDLTENMGKVLTVKELSAEIGVPERTIHNAIDRAFPGLKKNGFTTLLNENEITEISKELKKAHNSDLATTGKVVTTELEMKQKAAEVMAWLISESQRKDVIIAELEPKAEAADALMKSERTMSITECAKYFGLHPRSTVFPYLRDLGYLTSQDLPTQAAIDSGYMVLKKTVCADKVVRSQAMVLDCQLDTWRKRVIPQIKAWETK